MCVHPHSSKSELGLQLGCTQFRFCPKLTPTPFPLSPLVTSGWEEGRVLGPPRGLSSGRPRSQHEPKGVQTGVTRREAREPARPPTVLRKHGEALLASLQSISQEPINTSSGTLAKSFRALTDPTKILSNSIQGT